MANKTFEEKLQFMREHCETGYATDALNLLQIEYCWVESVQLQNNDKVTVAEAFTAQFSLVRDSEMENPVNMYQAVDKCPPAHMLFIAGIHDYQRVGINVMTRACNRGIAAVVVEGKNRDIKGIQELPMPMYSQGFSPKHPRLSQKFHHETGVTIHIGGAKINTGDVVIADGDGVVIIPRERFDEVFYQMEMIAEVEQQAAEANANKKDMHVDDFLKIIGQKKNPRK